jgi:hypothetical protein
MIRIFIGCGIIARGAGDDGGVSRYDSRDFIATGMHRSAKLQLFIIIAPGTNSATTPRCACAPATVQS